MVKTEENIKQLIKLIDYTSLNTLDTISSLKDWLSTLRNKPSELQPAAICVYPNLVNDILIEVPKGIKVAVVGGAFPFNQTFPDIRKKELEIISDLNLDEVDVVVQTKHVLNNDWDLVANDLAMVRETTKSKVLKIILETSVLKDSKIIEKAAQLSIDSGADFLKTSTGKDGAVADQNAVRTLCEVIKAHYESTSHQIGIKVSGGVRDFENASLYYSIVDEILGDKWLNPDYFRIGASSLLNTLIK